MAHNTHITDELPLLLTGELDRDGVLTVAEHLRTCVDCQHELISAAVAHSSLASARRFAPEIVTGAFSGAIADARYRDEDSDGEPPADLRNETVPLRLLKPVDAKSTAVPKNAVGPTHAPRHASGDDKAESADFVLPDLTAVFAQVRAEADSKNSTERAPKRERRTRMRIVSGLAAAAVVVGGGVAAVTLTGGDDTSNSPQAARTVQLAAYDVGTHTGTARITGSEMTVDATALPALSGERYEVWLSDGRSRLLPIGWIGSDGRADLTVPTDMSKFRYVQVSVQNVAADKYWFSGTSVLRGSLT